MKIIGHLIFLFTLSLSIKSQTTFQKTFGGIQNDYALSAKQTSDHGYIVLGVGKNDLYLIKTDINGDTLWTKTYGGANYELGNSVEQCSDGGYIITGYTTSFGAGGFDLFLIKTDSNGNVLWAKTYGGLSNDQGHCVHQTNDGGYIVFGDSQSFGAGLADFWLIKTDANGDSLWTKTYGGLNDESGTWVEQTSDNGYILSGTTKSFGPGAAYTNICLIKTNAIGDTLWTKVYGGSQDDARCYLQQTLDGGYIIAGETLSFGIGNGDIYLMKTDSAGNTNWTKTYGSTFIDDARSVRQTPDSGYIIGAYNSANGYDAYLIKTNSVGDTLWTRTYGGANTEAIHSIQPTMDGGFIAAGATSSFGAGTIDVLLIKTDSLGFSGCNYNGFTTTVNSANMITVTPILSISSGAIISNFIPFISSYGIANTLCEIILSANTNEIGQSKTSIKPNPFSNSTILKFSNEKKEKLNLLVYNTSGQLIVSIDNIRNDSIIIERSNMTNGLYFFQLLSSNQIISTGKFIIE